MFARATRLVLEPIGKALVVVMIGHLLLAAGFFYLLPFLRTLGEKKAAAAAARHERRYWFSPEDFTRISPTPPPAASAVSAPKKVATPAAPADSKKEETHAPVSPVMEAAPPAVPVPTPPAGAAPQPTVAPAAQIRPVNKVITLSPVMDEGSRPSPAAAGGRLPVSLMEVFKQKQREQAERDAAGGADMDPVLTALEQVLTREWLPPAVEQVPVLQRQTRLKIVLGRQGEVVESSLVKASGSVLMDTAVQEAVVRVKKISESLPSSFPKDRYTVEVNFHIE